MLYVNVVTTKRTCCTESVSFVINVKDPSESWFSAVILDFVESTADKTARPAATTNVFFYLSLKELKYHFCVIRFINKFS